MTRDLIKTYRLMYLILLIAAVYSTAIGFIKNNEGLAMAWLYFVMVFERDYLGNVPEILLYTTLLVFSPVPIKIIIGLILVKEVIETHGRRFIHSR